MKLKEFELWAFKQELAECRKFTLFSRSVYAHYERYFCQIETNGIYRVIIKLSESDKRDGTTELSSSVLKFYQPFDFIAFNRLGENEKKLCLLDTLHQALVKLTVMYEWSIEPFNQAYAAVLRDRFVNHYTFRKKHNRNRKLIAELECHHESTSFDCFVKIKNKIGEVLFSKCLFSAEPDEFLFNGLLGDIRWIDNETLVVLNKDKSESERIRVPNIMSQ